MTITLKTKQSRNNDDDNRYLFSRCRRKKNFIPYRRVTIPVRYRSLWVLMPLKMEDEEPDQIDIHHLDSDVKIMVFFFTTATVCCENSMQKYHIHSFIETRSNRFCFVSLVFIASDEQWKRRKEEFLIVFLILAENERK